MEELFEKLDQYPIGSKERIEGVTKEVEGYSIILKEPALLYIKGGVMGLGPNMGEPGGGYRLEIYKSGIELVLIHNSPTREGMIDSIEKELRKARVLQELI